ncbi:MAG: hypothetical protein ABWJ90_03595 [Thermus sp.]|uniref:hypothetical protein n=1 Tax=Thermus sp. TaxID=275 RepID=UPI00351B4994
MKRLWALLPFLLLAALADPPPPPQGQIDQGVRDFVTGVLGAMLNLNDWIALFKAAMRDFQSGAYTIGRSLIVVGLIWSLLRAVYYGSLEEILAAMARVVLAGGFLWFGEVLDQTFGGVDGVYYAVTNTFRTELAEAITEASNNLKALGAVINPLFTIVAILEAGVVNAAGTYLNTANGPDWLDKVMSGIGTAAQLLNPASLLLVPFVITAMVLTVIISTMFMLASAFWPIVAGSIALPIGLGPTLFGRWLSVVVWAFIMGAVGPFVVRGGMELGVARPAAYIASQAKTIVDDTVKALTDQYRTNREVFARNLQNLATANRWDPRICGFEVVVNPTDGRLDYRNVEPDPNAVLSPRACGIMTKEAIGLTMRQVGVTVAGIAKGLVDMFQAWVQTLFMTMGGMAAALLITGYLASLVASFFGGLSLAVTAAAIGYATGLAQRSMGGVVQAGAGAVQAAGMAAGAAGALAGGVAAKGAQAYGAAREWMASRGGSGDVPPSYERTAPGQEDPGAVPWRHRGAGYGPESQPIVVRGGPGEPVGYAPQGPLEGSPAPTAPGRWTDRSPYSRPSGEVVEGPPPPGRWAGRGDQTWVKGPNGEGGEG